MRKTSWLLVAALSLLGASTMSCRDSRGGTTPTDEDSGTPPVDTGNPTTDNPVTPMDTPRPDTGACTPTGDETSPAACMDGIDNDCNGFADCRDFSCSRGNPAVTFCPDAGPGRTDTGPARDVIRPEDTVGCVRMGSENTPAACGDGIDNDCDGFRDCADLNCSCQGSCPSSLAGCTCNGAENTNSACMDGVDNDCNGFSDCADFTCSRNTPAVTVCASMDGGAPRDVVTFNDAGPRADVRGCDSGGATENSPATCGDGIDNDCDGFTDCSDRNCSCVGTCGPAVSGCTCRGTETDNATCGDGVDNDCNNFVDCADFSCSMFTPAVTVCRDGGAGGNG